MTEDARKENVLTTTKRVRRPVNYIRQKVRKYETIRRESKQ